MKNSRYTIKHRESHAGSSLVPCQHDTMMMWLSEVDVSIVEPSENTLPVRHGSSFSLKCVARVRQPVDTSSAGRRPSMAATSTGLRWLHDGQPLADGTADGLCGRVLITDVVDVHTGTSPHHRTRFNSNHSCMTKTSSRPLGGANEPQPT